MAVLLTSQPVTRQVGFACSALGRQLQEPIAGHVAASAYSALRVLGRQRQHKRANQESQTPKGIGRGPLNGDEIKSTEADAPRGEVTQAAGVLTPLHSTHRANRTKQIVPSVQQQHMLLVCWHTFHLSYNGFRSRG